MSWDLEKEREKMMKGVWKNHSAKIVESGQFAEITFNDDKNGMANGLRFTFNGSRNMFVSGDYRSAVYDFDSPLSPKKILYNYPLQSYLYMFEKLEAYQGNKMIIDEVRLREELDTMSEWSSVCADDIEDIISTIWQCIHGGSTFDEFIGEISDLFEYDDLEHLLNCWMPCPDHIVYMIALEECSRQLKDYFREKESAA
ncbi:hypothetical protein [Culicoidibacter larvae]|uniref:Uncharacterized protein n=1 Tax=Culicoidibacter larvae TaxID=2579976 RepID=A0A5R8Q8T6_9FIRM|nr:hypothetical protein [Culicoidibacter larvae]TLG70268.1 hypothetical protein FEZ08_12020 [Culicoidibacter larvae]